MKKKMGIPNIHLSNSFRRKYNAKVIISENRKFSKMGKKQ